MRLAFRPIKSTVPDRNRLRRTLGDSGSLCAFFGDSIELFITKDGFALDEDWFSGRTIVMFVLFLAFKSNLVAFAFFFNLWASQAWPIVWADEV